MLLCFWFSFLPVMIRKRKFYNKTSLDSALADIKMNKLSAKKVSIKLEVPVRTLRYRNKNWVSEQVSNSWPGNELGTICKLLYRKSFSFDTEKWLRYPLTHKIVPFIKLFVLSKLFILFKLLLKFSNSF